MKTVFKLFLFIATIFVLGYGLAFAQSEEITLKFTRDFGYSGGGNIQGLFSMKVSSSVDITEVEFYMDSEQIGKDEVEPFSFQFNTDNYSPGEHTLYAIGYLNNGEALKSKVKIVYFITAEESRKATLNLIVPILGLSLVAVVASALIPGLFPKRKGIVNLRSTRNYGAAGGTICSRCDRPFARHVFAPNMLLGKLERCPHCGKWGIFRSYPIDDLRKAEEEELKSEKIKNSSIPVADEEEIIRNELDSTKYQDM